MIAGLLTDALVVGAVLAFSWGAVQLGGLSSLGRLVEATIAFVVAALLRDPAGAVMDAVIGRSEAFGNLVGMLAVGGATWLGAHAVYRWWRARRASLRRGDDELAEFDADAGDDPLDTPLVARLAGGVLGLGWSVLFVALLVLQPADTPISRAAVDSRVGGVLIQHRDGLEWLRDGFPNYTQSLPKGTLGAVTGERSGLPLHEPVEVTDRPQDADALLREVNGLRRAAQLPVLAFNPDVASVARRHARSLVLDERLSERTAGGSALDARAIAALGESARDFDDEVGIEVVWAHDPVTAMRGLLEREESQDRLREERWSEVGIGVADMGWFNGRIYVLLLVGPADDADGELADGAAGAAAAIGSDAGLDDAAEAEVEEIEHGIVEGVDAAAQECVEPDRGSGDPALFDCESGSGR